MDEDKCKVCLSSGFKAGALDKDNVCTQCNKLWPGAKTPEDRKKKNKPEVENHETQTVELITKQIDSILESYGILHKCLTCGTLYYKRSPAQKGCGCNKEDK